MSDEEGEVIGYTMGFDGGERQPIYAAKKKPPLHILVIPETMCPDCKRKAVEMLASYGITVPQ